MHLNLTFREKIGGIITYNGRYSYDGSIDYSQCFGFFDRVRYAASPQIVDRVHCVGAKSKTAIRVRKDTEYNGEISYDGSHTYNGYTVEEVQ
jgi:hypothetical protein